MLERYDYGVLGVGEIGSAIVTGLCEGVDDAPSVLVSPRNAERAAWLAARYPSVTVAPDNGAVVERAAVAVVAIRPKDAPDVLGGLAFRAEQAVVSLMAGVSAGELASLVAPTRDIARAIPLPPVARRTGITPVLPGTPAARGLFTRLGGVSVVEDAGAFEAMAAASGTVAAHLRYVATVSAWLSGQGVAAQEAARYVRSIYAGLAADLGGVDGDLEEIAQAHATPGGINERFSAMLGQAGVFDAVANSLQAIYEGLQAPDHAAS